MQQKLKIAALNRYFYVLIVSLCLALYHYNNNAGIIMSALSVAFIACFEIIYAIKKRNFSAYLKNISKYIDISKIKNLDFFPMPVLVMQPDGEIVLANKNFENILPLNSCKTNIFSIIPEFPRAMTPQTEEGVSITVNNRHYTIYQSEIITPSSSLRVVFFNDDTALKNIALSYSRTRPVLGIIVVDGFEDVLSSLPDNEKTQIISRIDLTLSEWAKDIHAFLKKIEKDRYIIVMQNRFLKRLRQNRFEILEKIHDISQGYMAPITLSIGIGAGDDDYNELEVFARKALDFAMGRGGDQAVVQTGDELEFYGGRTKTLEKRFVTHTRIICQKLIQLFKKSDNIVVMGHVNPDLDAIGACVGIYALAKAVNKKASIVVDFNKNLSKIMLNELLDNPEYQKVIVDKADAKNLMYSNTVLVVVDTHRGNYTQSPNLLDMCENIVVIDHHRKSPDCIENTEILYQNPHASSCCEMIGELCMYMSQTGYQPLSALEAEILMAGIMLDTKNYTINTGMRTFEISSYLRSLGADPIRIRRFFKNEKGVYKDKLTIIDNAEIYFTSFAISKVADIEITEEFAATASQAADELLSLKGVDASFVLFENQKTIKVSARSNESINVQIIMEKIGGGGHQNIAGAQLDCTLDEAEELLIKAIEEYIKS